MHLSPDQIIYWQMGFLKLNATIVFTWLIILVLVLGSIFITRKLSSGLQRSRWQNVLEVVVITINKQIEEVGLSQPHKYLGFLGSLFLFIALCALGTVVPGFEPPTGSLSMCFGGCAVIWYSRARFLALSRFLYQTNYYYAAF